MQDKTNPTSQFHPYQPVEATPVAERPSTGFKNVRAKMQNIAASNPGALLGGIAAAAIGIGILAGKKRS